LRQVRLSLRLWLRDTRFQLALNSQENIVRKLQFWMIGYVHRGARINSLLSIHIFSVFNSVRMPDKDDAMPLSSGGPPYNFRIRLFETFLFLSIVYQLTL
jgi:hypothetical protein